eukprot:5909642-Amphidinium_carterae.1
MAKDAIMVLRRPAAPARRSGGQTAHGKTEHCHDDSVISDISQTTDKQVELVIADDVMAAPY